jgi:hypothetical protein
MFFGALIYIFKGYGLFEFRSQSLFVEDYFPIGRIIWRNENGKIQIKVFLVCVNKSKWNVPVGFIYDLNGKILANIITILRGDDGVRDDCDWPMSCYINNNVGANPEIDSSCFSVSMNMRLPSPMSGVRRGIKGNFDQKAFTGGDDILLQWNHNAVAIRIDAVNYKGLIADRPESYFMEKPGFLGDLSEINSFGTQFQSRPGERPGSYNKKKDQE